VHELKAKGVALKATGRYVIRPRAPEEPLDLFRDDNGTAEAPSGEAAVLALPG
jgi:hypothetical protein